MEPAAPQGAAGKAMVSDAGIVNFQLSGRMTGKDLNLGLPGLILPKHSEVFARYALTAYQEGQVKKWGYVGSGQFSERPRGFIWKELDESESGHFVTDRLLQAEIEDFAEELANETLRLARKTVDLVEAAVNITVAGANRALNSVMQIAQNAADKIKMVNDCFAESPTITLIDVSFPTDTEILSFTLSVVDSGNSDVLLVGIGDRVLQRIDLDAVLLGGTATFTVPVSEYAGTTSTLAFYMPSEETSDAQFVVSDVQLLTLNRPPLVTLVLKQACPSPLKS